MIIDVAVSGKRRLYRKVRLRNYWICESYGTTEVYFN